MEIHWVPGHMGIDGNEKTDETAKKVAETNGTRGFPERFTYLSHMECTVTEQKWKEAKHWF